MKKRNIDKHHRRGFYIDFKFIERLFLAGVLVFFSFSVAKAAEIKPFTTDGCSMYPDGPPLVSPKRWYHCCFTHDMAYWAGGSADARLKADEELGQCVAEVSTNPHGWAMKNGVRLGGYPYGLFPWEWGYGFEGKSPYLDKSIWNKKEVFANYDSILKALISEKEGLKRWQIHYIVSRFELLRHELALQIEIPYEDEMTSMDWRVEQVLKLYE